MNKTWSVFKHEFLKTVSRRSFILTLILVPLVPAVILWILGNLSDSQSQSLQQVFTGGQPQSALPYGAVDHSGLLTEAPESVRTAILAAVSHDLRTPVAGIKAALATVLDPDLTLAPADEHELLLQAAEATDRLDALLANLLDLSRLQTGAVRPVLEPVSVVEVVDGALAGLPAGSVVDETGEDLPLIVTDEGLLERVLANIIENAVRHNPTGEPVRVTAAVVPGGSVEVRVADRGPGVRAEERDRMFEPFQRLGDAPAGDGVGLGLAVARGLTDAMGGTVDAEDTPGGGLTMVVTLPSRSLAEAPSGSGERP